MRGVLRVNPAAAVRGPAFSRLRGATPVLDRDQVKRLLESIDNHSLKGLRDRALISLLLFSWARIEAALPRSPPESLDFLPPQPPPPRDRHEFYWKDEKPREPISRWRFECEEFRHHGEHEDFQVHLLVPSDYSRESGALRFRVTAENAPERLEVTQRYSISYEQADIESQLANLLPWLHSTGLAAAEGDGTEEGAG